MWTAAALALFAAAVATSAADAAGGGARRPPASALPLRTRGRHVVDAAGRPLRLACVNWYGAHLQQMVATGLDVRPAADIAATIAELGFNCVRLPFSLDLVFENRTRVPEPSRWLAANPELQGLGPLEVFDATVAALTGAGLLVILNNHISSGGWCCGFRDDEGLWYTEKYPEPLWLEGLGLMAARYRGDPRVVGFDLRNELRPAASGVPTWGSGDPETDWAAAAEKGGRRVAAENEHMLVVVSGMLYCMFLCDVPATPVHLSPALRGRTVYTAHEYGMTSIQLQVRDVLVRSLPVLAACHVGLWLVLLAAELPACNRGARARAGAGAEVERPLATAGGRLRPRCRLSTRVANCLQVFAALSPVMALLGVAAVFSRYVPACGFARSASTLASVTAAALLSLASLELWLLAVAHRLCGRRWKRPLGDSRSTGGAEPEDPEMLEVPIWSATGRTREPPPQLQRREPTAGAGPARGRRLCGALGCSRWLLASAATAAALAALLVLLSRSGSYEAFADELDGRWGFLVAGGLRSEEATAPVWLGEFGETRESQWWHYLTRYLGDREEVGWAYWSLNGDPQHPYMALLLEDSRTVRHPWKLKALQGLMASASH